MATAPSQTEPATAHTPGLAWLIPAAMLIIPTVAILVWWLWPPNADVRELSESPSVARAGMKALPGYVLETDGGMPVDSAEPERHRYRLDSTFDWRLRPAADVAGDVAIRAFVFPEAPTIGDARMLALGQLGTVEARGVARVHGVVRGLDLAAGRYTIALVVGRPGSLPNEAAAVHGSAGTDTWTLRRLAIEIE